MILLEIPVKDWSDWALNQVGVAVAAMIVCYFLYKLYLKTLASKDEIVKRERDRLLEELDEAQAECNQKDALLLSIQKEYHEQLRVIHDNYTGRLSDIQKEHNEIAMKTVEALGQTSNLIEGAILNKMDLQGQKTREAINLMRSDIVGKIDALNQKA